MYPVEPPKTMKITQKATEFCEDTTAHGLRNIVKTDSWLFRILWVFLFVIAVLYCGYCNNLTVHSFEFLYIMFKKSDLSVDSCLL